MQQGAMWGALVGTLTNERLTQDITGYLTWSVIVFVFGVPICIIVASYITEGVFKLSKTVAGMGAAKMQNTNRKVADDWKMATAGGSFAGSWRSETGQYGEVKQELGKLGYVRGGNQIQTEYWVALEHKQGRPDVIKVQTFSDQVQAARAQGSRPKRKVGPVKK